MTPTHRRLLAITVVAFLALVPQAKGQGVRLYDDFAASAPDASRWEAITQVGRGQAALSIENGAMVVRGADAESRNGAASRVRLGRKFAVEADALGYDGVNQILQVYSGEGDFARYVEFGIEGKATDGTPMLHVWPSPGHPWEGPAPQASVGPDRPLRLRIERDGETFRFFANGRQVHTTTTGALTDEARVVLYGFGQSVSRWDNVRLSGPDVWITSPEQGRTVKEAIDVAGTVGADAAAWTLAAGEGDYPHVWRNIASGKGPTDGRLGRWTPAENTAGAVTLRLTATDDRGVTRSHWTPIVLDRAAIAQPREGQVVGPAFTVAVDGSLANIAKVRFFDNGHLKAESAAAPYWARLTPSTDGRHAMTVEIVSRDGKSERVGPVNVTVKRNLYGRNARVADHGRAFVFPDGSVGPAIGHNDSYTWDALRPLWVKGDAESVQGVAAYLRKQRASGVNVLRIMLEGIVPPPEDLLEKPLGTYSKSVVRFWDTFLPLCERHGMTVLITPWDTFWMNQPWSASPYNKANGGPITEQADFIRDPEARRWQKARLKYMIDRWGTSPAIFAIDLLNEFDIWWDPATPRERAEWVEEMAAYTRDYQLRKWGHAHMLTVSSAAAEPRGAIGEAVYRHPLFEFANTHLYYWGTVSSPKDLAGPARAINHGVRYALEQIRDGRPYTDSESGPINMTAPWLTNEGAFDDEYFRTMSWAHFASGGAGTGMRWPYRFPHILSDGMNRAQLSIAQVANHLDWSTFQPENADDRLTLDREGFLKMASADRRQAVAWVMREDAPDRANASAKKPPITGVRLALSGMAAGRYTVTCWDATKGIPIKRETITARDGRVEVSLPPVALDMAVTVRH